ncbi:cytidine deaminase [Parvicella tangerina]|uniref:Cytidine deaminase n=1 Tax=Parvicella tangerina TaxID=2829795 RepID=A0A916JNE6_9FLAO|nr:cytidine deaminase [Parvicella tangerina]CAG5082656.1 Cytidine deaminase [Parvicella tangerina]
MENRTINISYQLFASKEELSEENAMLISKAEEALENAYAVYSKFHVGAALLLDNGEVVTGNNQENIAYPSSLCAERVALYYCKAHYPDAVVKKIAIMAKSEEGDLLEVISPCGGCRQVMSEYERVQKEDMQVILKGERDSIMVFDSVKDLLPLSFNTKVLGA